MAKKHMKRIASPKSWKIRRKEYVFTVNPLPGSHKKTESIPVSIVIRDILGLAKTMKEVKVILNTKTVMVNKKIVREHKAIVGFMDVFEIKELNKCFRATYDNNGKLIFVDIDPKESALVPLKFVKKTKTKKGMQFNFSNGINILNLSDDLKTGDSIIYDFQSKKTICTFKLEPGAVVFVTGGKMIGNVCKVLSIESDNIILETQDNQKVTTIKKNLLVIGKEKPFIKVK